MTHITTINDERCRYLCNHAKTTLKCIVNADYTTRNPRNLIKILEPCIFKDDTGINTLFYWVIKEKWRHNIYCIIGNNYRVETRRQHASDHLSGLAMNLIRLDAYVDETLVWRSKWVKTRYGFEMKIPHITLC